RALDTRAYSYAIPELSRLAAAEPAKLYIAQTHAALPAAARAARRTHSPYAFDAEDLLADCPDEPAHIARRIERGYADDCAFVATMSEVAGTRLAETNDLSKSPIVLYNTPLLEEGAEVPFPEARGPDWCPVIYWFGQTLGPHSCAEEIIRALPLLTR